MKNDIKSLAEVYAKQVVLNEKKETKQADFGFAEKQKEKKTKDGAPEVKKDTKKKKTMKESTQRYLGAFDRLYSKAVGLNENMDFGGPDLGADDGLEAEVHAELGDEVGDETADEVTLTISKDEAKALIGVIEKLKALVGDDEAVEGDEGEGDEAAEGELETEVEVAPVNEESVEMKPAPSADILQKKDNKVDGVLKQTQGGKADGKVTAEVDGDGKPVKKTDVLQKKDNKVPQKTDNFFGKK